MDSRVKYRWDLLTTMVYKLFQISRLSIIKLAGTPVKLGTVIFHKIPNGVFINQLFVRQNYFKIDMDY